MADGIFIRILPKLDAAAMAGVLSQMTNVFGRAGRDISGGLSAATAEANRLQSAMVAAGNAATAASIKADQAAYAAAAANRRAERAIAASAGAPKTAAIGDREIAAIGAADIANRKYALGKQQAAQADAQAAATADAHTAAMARAAGGGVILGESMNKAAFGVTALTTALVGAGLDAAGKYEAQIVRIGAATEAFGDTTKSLASGALKQLHDGLLDLSSSMGESLGNLTQAAYQLQKYGGVFQDVGNDIKFLRAAIEVGKIDNVPLIDVINGAAGAARAFNADSNTMINQLAQLKRAAAEMPTGTAGDLSRSLGNITAQASVALGPNNPTGFAQILTAVTRASKFNLSPERATQNIENMLSHIANPNGPQAQYEGGLLAKIGMKPSDLSLGLRDPNKGLLWASQMLQQAIAANTDASGNVQVPIRQTNQDVINKVAAARDAIKSPKEKDLANLFLADVQAGVEPSTDLRKEIRQARLSPDFAGFMSLANSALGFSASGKNQKSLTQSVAEAQKQSTGSESGDKILAALAGNPAALAATQGEFTGLMQERPDRKGDISGWDAVLKTLKQKMQELEASLQRLAVVAGEQFLPAFKKIVDEATKLLSFLNQHQTLLHGILTTSEGIAVVWGANKILGGIMGATSALGKMNTTLATTATETRAVETAGAGIGTSFTRGAAVAEGALGRLGGMLAGIARLGGALMLGGAAGEVMNGGPGGPDWLKAASMGALGGGMLSGWNPLGWALMAGGGVGLGVDWFLHRNQHPSAGAGGAGGGVGAFQPGQGWEGVGGAPQGGAPPSDADNANTDPFAGVGPPEAGGDGGGSEGDIDASTLPGYINPAEVPPEYQSAVEEYDNALKAYAKKPTGENLNKLQVAKEKLMNPKKGRSGSSGGTNAFSDAFSKGMQHGGVLGGVVDLMTRFVANLALGNPVGQDALGNVSKYAWWYQGPGSDVGHTGAGSMNGLTQAQTENLGIVNSLSSGYAGLNSAMGGGGGGGGNGPSGFGGGGFNGPPSTGGSFNGAPGGSGGSGGGGGAPGGGDVVPDFPGMTSSGMPQPTTGALPFPGRVGGRTAEQNAADIVTAAKERGLNKEQTMVALAIAMQETGLGTNPRTNDVQDQNGTKGIQGMFQQDETYTYDKTVPLNTARGFIDRFIKAGGLTSGNPWGLGVHGVQRPARLGQGGYDDTTGEYIKQRWGPQAAQIYDKLTGGPSVPSGDWGQRQQQINFGDSPGGPLDYKSLYPDSAPGPAAPGMFRRSGQGWIKPAPDHQGSGSFNWPKEWEILGYAGQQIGRSGVGHHVLHQWDAAKSMWHGLGSFVKNAKGSDPVGSLFKHMLANLQIGQFAGGGKVGGSGGNKDDNILAWLSPGETVIPAFDEGGTVGPAGASQPPPGMVGSGSGIGATGGLGPLGGGPMGGNKGGGGDPGAPTIAPPPPPPTPPAPTVEPKPPAPQPTQAPALTAPPGSPTAPPAPGGAARGPGMDPRATTQPQGTEDQPHGSAITGSGLIGFGESSLAQIATSALSGASGGPAPAGIAAGAAGQLAAQLWEQIGEQEANLAVSKIGDIGSILGVEAPLETLTLHGPEGQSGDLSSTLPFKLLGAFAESHPNVPDTAGTHGPADTQSPENQRRGQGRTQQRQGDVGDQIGVNVEDMHFYGNNDPNQVTQGIQRAVMSAPGGNQMINRPTG